MYTSCPECGTVFRITTQELRAAEGYVRCGHCSATFNAVATLTDEVPPTLTLPQLVAEAGGPVLTPDGIGAAPDPEPEPPPAAALQPERRSEAESEPGPKAVQRPAAHPVTASGTTAGSGPTTPRDDSAEDPLEFNVPEDSWSNFFEAPAVVPASPASLPATAPAEDTASPFAELEADEVKRPAAPVTEPPAETGAGVFRALSESDLRIGGEDGEWQALLAEVREWEPEEPVYVLGEDSDGDTAEHPVLAIDADMPADPAGTAGLTATAAAVPEAAIDAEPEAEVEAEAERNLASQPFIWGPPPAPPEPRRHWAWMAGSAVLALAGSLQLIHFERDSLATNPRLTEPLQRLYRALDMPLYPAWDLSSYELRGSEAVAGRTNPAALEILARIAVVGNAPTGLPLVRVRLRDRFGKELGSRVFTPGDYLAGAPAPREPVTPGTLIPVQITLRDPGTDAYGFDVDICLMTRRDGIICRAERQPFVR